MAKFEKLSFWYMCAMSFVTIGLYPLAWVVDTARRLRVNGGKVPSTYFYFAPVLIVTLYLVISLVLGLVSEFDFFIKNRAWFDTIKDNLIWVNCLRILFWTPVIYFWFGYISSYCQIVLHKNDNKSIWAYFVYFVLALVLKESFVYVVEYVKKIDLIQAFVDSSVNNHSPIFKTAIFEIFDVSLGVLIINLISFIILHVILNNLIFFLFFQRGFNKYVEQNY